MQEKQYLTKQQIRKVLLTKFHEYSALWRITSPFSSQLIFFRLFYISKSFTSRGKIQRFVAPDRSRKISLQDSAGIRYKDVYDVAPLKKSICFSTASRLVLSPAVGHINWLCILLSSNFLFVFVKRSWRWNFPPNRGGQQPMQLPTKQTLAHWHCGIAYIRTYGQTDGSDVMT